MKSRKRFYVDLNSSATVQAMVLYPPGADQAAPIRELTEQVIEFQSALDEWKADANVAPGLRRVK